MGPTHENAGLFAKIGPNQDRAQLKALLTEGCSIVRLAGMGSEQARFRALPHRRDLTKAQHHATLCQKRRAEASLQSSASSRMFSATLFQLTRSCCGVPSTSNSNKPLLSSAGGRASNCIEALAAS